jgi:hypothetical protein
VKRLAINRGVRWERYNDFYPTQTKPAGQFADIFPAQTFSGQEILSWSDVVPRVGAAWDAFGNGKTVIKGSFGMFGDTMGDVFSETFNPNAQRSNTYNWTGPCNSTAPNAPIEYACDVTPAFLSTLPSLTPITETGGTSQVLNSGLKQDKTYEYTAKIERQIVPNVGLTGTYVYHAVYNMYDSATNAGLVTPTADVVGNGVDVGHPYGSWNIPVVFTDTFNGASTPVTVWTYAKGSGAISNEVVNNPSDRPDTYKSFEVAVTKRSSKKWNAMASYWVTKDHRWLQGTEGIEGSPNDDAYPIDNTWNWEARGNVGYNFPFRITLSSFYRAQSGTAGQRLEAFNSSALNQGSTTIRMGPFGQYRGPFISTWNTKVAKTIVFRDRYHLELNFQEFNLLNDSAAVTTNYLTGSTFGVVTSLISPRVARFGMLFSF